LFAHYVVVLEKTCLQSLIASILKEMRKWPQSVSCTSQSSGWLPTRRRIIRFVKLDWFFAEKRLLSTL